MYKHVLHIFRRDLRLIDNSSLLFAASSSKISVGFIFDSAQTGDSNSYKSLPALSFMLDSLEELAREVRERGGSLNFWHGRPEAVLEEVLKESSVDCVTVNMDYTPFSMARDERIAAVCEKHGVSFVSHHDALLTPPGKVLTSAREAFKIFTPFYKAAATEVVAKPQMRQDFLFAKGLLPEAYGEILYERIFPLGQRQTPNHVRSGRSGGLSMLREVGNLHEYETERNYPSLDAATTHLSPHNKFGTVSIREVYWAIKDALAYKAEPILRSLYWRDFFTHILFAKPAVLGHAYKERYDELWWENDEKKFAAWCEGKTGFPIVDAGMRELIKTGYMHNRVRMITASFLVKDLHIDWRWGERYFAQKLADYDPAVNNGNWQWVASTGCDAQPYFRIFNPWLQQKKFDPDAEYIKQWVPELKLFSADIIHTIFKKPVTGYRVPIVDHAIESKKTLITYKKIIE
ncbi:MAG: deoxyribodipyrimidine photo-lyase [Candidatus Dependentiae bacterium]|nr:deoxyribodipyrimidine photo-lyase [Candidatus Dependentiae bacterium]